MPIRNDDPGGGAVSSSDKKNLESIVYPSPFDYISSQDENPDDSVTIISHAPFPKAKPKKRRRSEYTDEEQLAAVKAWEQEDTYQTGRTLRDFLEARFGSEKGYLKVSERRYYDWRSKFKKLGLI